MTEDEAKQKWCPFARVIGLVENSAGNRHANTLHVEPAWGAQCLGSGCMVWRWDSPEYGHCGLAGEQR